GVQGFLQMLVHRRQSLQGGAGEQEPWPELDLALRELERAGHLSRNLLAAARPRVRTAVITLGELVQEIARPLRERCREAKVAVDVQVEAESLTVAVDLSRMKQVFLNLENNALEAF